MRYEEVGGGMMPAMRIAITHSTDEAAKEVTRCMGAQEADRLTAMSECSDAMTSRLIDPASGEVLYLVTMTDYTGYDLCDEAAVLAHEAVHIAIGYLADIGEDVPGEEETAYAVQAASAYLMAEHFRWREGQAAA